MTHDTRLEGSNILVLGGGFGIGRGAALAYRDAGARVVVVERSMVNAESLAAESGIEVVVGDATEPEVISESIRTATQGGVGLSNVTCCVGVFDHYASLRTLQADEFAAAAQEMWRLNVLSALSAARLAWPALQGARGSLTLTLSESAFHPVGGGVLYGSSKWALRGVVAHLAADFAPEVRVNGVAPGGTSGTSFSGLAALAQDTLSVDASAGRDERIAKGTLLGSTPTPQDHGSAYVYLADPVGARIITGTVINSDGGRAR
ncbi:SDR family oxidoreductase [Rhodococcus fascians]|nr:SDR family oxidoreductase [Rhodococcus fascians]MBY3826506.1 SDR family oxidoreductase [Rhodococcus fascians]MBY3836967.1 SDR family oxidoreductase [Rhodococcus fascians]MBY3865566.1 SDR family oxidoreductase [Rhodococcus fascians]MBY3885649.1 SDR family oxidoreductase [Rhodococcus fascians]